MQSGSKAPGNGRQLAIHVGFLTVFSFVLYQAIFTYNTFGPETALFYMGNDGQPFSNVLRAYTYTNIMWYRPTAFALPYWILEQFFGWHNLVAWKFFHFWTVLAAAYAVYWLVVRCLRASPMAGLLSATYFISQPSLYAAVMEVAGFDFLHIFFTVVSVGFYLQGTRARGRRCLLLTAFSCLMFIVAITAKEMALATPGFLLTAAVLGIWLEPGDQPLRARLRREFLRILPFFGILVAYYFLHITKIPPATFQSGPYRSSTNWGIILANLRKLPLWVVRIYAWSDQTLQVRMYQSNTLNNTVGIVSLLLVIAGWRRLLRIAPPYRLTLLLMLAWSAIYLVLPIYSGGFVWHINLAVVGYCVLFGIGISSLLDAIATPVVRRAVVAAFFLGWLLLSREDLRIELYAGSHTTAFQINHSVLDHPPVPAAALGRAPLIYIEDRLGMGGWWYGCYGSLFKFAYLRHDLEEVVVPQMASVTPEARAKWLAHDNAFFFRYDADFNWHDVSADFRASVFDRAAILPGQTCSTGLPHRSGPVRIAAGRSQWTAPSGAAWESDNAYDGGQSYTSSHAVAGTPTPELYTHERFHDAPFGYRFCVANGKYTVKLKFAEIWFTEPGKRIFDVAINDVPVLTHFDVAAAAGGPDRALDREFPVQVADGQIAIQFRPVVSNPKISAIEIVPRN